MATHLFLVHNLYNERQDRARVVTAEEEAPGFEAWHVATGRRNPDDRWQAITANSATWIATDAGAVVACDVVAIDRGHNLAGKTVALERDDNSGFSSPVTVFSVTFPSAAAASTSIDAANGAYTEEGAWIKRFAQASDRYWRLTVASAASYIPQIVGLWLGKAWSPPFPMQKRDANEDRQVGGDSLESDFGWRSRSTTWRRRQGEAILRLSAAELANARDFHLEITKARPFWFVHDTAKAERAFLAALPPQVARFAFEPGWHPETLSFQWEEYEAVLP